MRPAILELWEVGFFQVPFYIGEPYLFCSFWAALLIGVMIQLLLMKKCKRPWARWSFTALTLVGLLVSEILCQVITGWDLLAAMFLYALFLTFLLGIGLVCAITYLQRKKPHTER